MPKKKKKQKRLSQPRVPLLSKFARVASVPSSPSGTASSPPISTGGTLPGSASIHSDFSNTVEIKGSLPSSPVDMTFYAPSPNPVSEISSAVVKPSLQNPEKPLRVVTGEVTHASNPPPATDDTVEIKGSLPSSPGETADTHSQPANAPLPWAKKFKTSLRNLKKMSPPTFLEDGTPVVQAPTSVLLKAAEMWKGHIVAQFHGICPPPAKIYADLNPIWGKFGNITVRIISETAALLFIPSVTTREWVLEVGFWQAGNCSCTVYPWSPEGPLELEELQSAPTWAILKNIPPQLYSLEGISVVASAIGDPLHTEKSRLDPINIGVTKVKVIIQLDATLPTTVVVRDSLGNTARVAVEYPRPPPKCVNCGRYGQLLNRCPQPLLKKTPFRPNVPSGSKEVTHPTVTLPTSHRTRPDDDKLTTSVTEPRLSKPRRNRSRSKKRSTSTPPRIASQLAADKGSVLSPVNLPEIPPFKPRAASRDSDPRLTLPPSRLRAGSESTSTSDISKTVMEPTLAEDPVSKDGVKVAKIETPILPLGWAVMSDMAKEKYVQKRRVINNLQTAGSSAADRGAPPRGVNPS